MSKCIFDDYHVKDKECKRELECEGCETFDKIHTLIAAALRERYDNQEIQETENRS